MIFWALERIRILLTSNQVLGEDNTRTSNEETSEFSHKQSELPDRPAKIYSRADNESNYSRTPAKAQSIRTIVAVEAMIRKYDGFAKQEFGSDELEEMLNCEDDEKNRLKPF